MATRADLAALGRLRAIGDRATPAVRRQVERALRELGRSVPLARLERVLQSRDALAVHDLAASLPRRLGPALRTLERVHAEGARAGAALLTTRGAKVGMRFDVADAFAVRAAREYGARLVTRVTQETRRAIRTVVARSFTEGIPPREAARLLKPLIGLTERQGVAALNLRRRLLDGGASRAEASARATAYADRLLGKRATMIARTETIAAASQGQLESWREAERRGLVRPGAQKVWMVTPDDRLCPQCEPLDEMAVPVHADFLPGVSAPPLHPLCRCAVTVMAVPAPRADKVDTLATFRRPDGTWEPSRQRMHDRIVRAQLRGVKRSAAPTVYLTGGGPASGKSAMLKSGAVSFPRRGLAVHTDADAMKALLPEYAAGVRLGDPLASAVVHEESSYLAKRVAREAAARRMDIVLDQVGDSGIDKLTEKVLELRKQGHRVVASYASNDVDLAVRLAHQRGLKTGRFVPESYIRAAHADVSRTFEAALERELFDELRLYDTNVKDRARLVASRVRGEATVIHDEGLWRTFRLKGQQ